MRRWLWGLLAVGCSAKDSSEFVDSGPRSALPLYAASTSTLRFEFDYAYLADPFVGGIDGSEDPWELFDANLSALLQGQRALELPHELGQMEALGELGEGPFDREAILALADAHRDQVDHDDVVTLYVIWLRGYYADETGPRPDVSSLSFGDTGVIAMFKPVIDDLGSTRALRAISEQTLLLHEVGHALGLVDNGLPMTSGHLDRTAGPHCSEDGCVMGWANTGWAPEFLLYLEGDLALQDTFIFGEACQADVAAGLGG
ncbi:MAG: hypothetical protein H6741_08590 [Alphaproteobacteria bacterium]|nr:hypothetical protein [Alphaproteobacteria bacterium]MCB9792775.1 hypothetical protein [Alphaproteobacteria bacterium]